MLNPPIGIDFGTTNSVLAVYTPASAPTVIPVDTPADAEWADLGFDLLLPSVFGVTPTDKPVFGWQAKLDTSLEAQGRRVQAVKRLFRDQSHITIAGRKFLVEEVATMMFGHMLTAAHRSGIDPRKAVITVPATSRALARFRTKAAGGMSGLQTLALINEPTAAALTYAHQNPDAQRIMVIDWGGGTLDVTVLDVFNGIFVERSSSGIPQLGGIDFDARIAAAIDAHYPLSRQWTRRQRAEFRLEVEKAKIRLSTVTSTLIPVPDGDPYTLTREQLTTWVAPLIQQASLPLSRVVKDLHITGRDLDAVVLVGGTSKMPAVREFMEEFLSVSIDSTIDPMTAVAQGAATAAAILTGDEPDKRFQVSTEHALGIYVRNPKDPLGKQIFSSIIPRNEPLPASVSAKYAPANPNTDTVILDVVEGEQGLLEDDPRNTPYATYEIPVRKDLAYEDRGFEVTYEYDADGIIHITTTSRYDGQVTFQAHVAPGITPDKDALLAAARRAKLGLTEQHIIPAEREPFVPEHEELLRTARVAVLPYLSGVEALEVRAKATRLANAPLGEREHAAQELRLTLARHNRLF